MSRLTSLQMDAATDAAVEQAYGLLAELGEHGWDFDVALLPGDAVILTATKGDTTIKRWCCREVAESVLSLYADARRLDQVRPVETLN
jgi:hypothetical protein